MNAQTNLRIAFGGSAAWPPHKGHMAALKAVRRSGDFDLIIWYPSGSSKFKGDLGDPIHRAMMSTLAIPKDWLTHPRDHGARLIVNTADVFHKDTPTYDRFAQIRAYFKALGYTPSVTFFTGSDSVTPDEDGYIPMKRWVNGAKLWRMPITVLPRRGYANPATLRLPKNFRWIECNLPDIASSDIREMVAAHKRGWSNLVPDLVAQYIRINGLFKEQGAP